MGDRGPAPKPTALRVLHGDRKDRINTSEPMPREALPEPPDYLSPAALDVWHYIVNELRYMRTITAADRDALAVYCSAVATHAAAQSKVNDSDVLIKSSRGPIKNPALQIVRDQAAIIRSLARDFGLTPSARSGISLGDDGDDLEALFTN